MQPRTLPKDVLAQYLARKESLAKGQNKTVARAPAPAPAQAGRSAAVAVAQPSADPIRREVPPPVAPVTPDQIQDDLDVAANDSRPLTAEELKQAQQAVAQSKVEDLAKQEVTRTQTQASQQARRTEVVRAPAQPVDKFLPTEQRRAAAAPVTGSSAFSEADATRVPGSLVFASNEVTIEAPTRMSLDQTSKYLIDNPSSRVVFRAVSGPNEAAALVDSRFESIKTYLVEKGVPEDQIQLDGRRRVGTRAEFETFVVEAGR
jgi:outer membrane protein OmpA-like peptidoglycan-associated protein